MLFLALLASRFGLALMREMISAHTIETPASALEDLPEINDISYRCAASG